MFESFLFIIAGFFGGWGMRGIRERGKKLQALQEPEMMWFNNEKSQWERVTEMQLLVDGRSIVTVPVKLIEDQHHSG